jgi:hypothetical protein
MAASERKRHGKDCDPEMRRDASQDVALEMLRTVAANIAANTGDDRPADSFYPIADLIDQERPTVSGHGGERIMDRPNRDLIALAGSHLDAALSDQDVSLDAMAGDGATLVAASAATRDRAESLRSMAAQVIDPTVSPVPAELDRAADHCGLWADDPLRHALRVAVVGHCHPMTAEDWTRIDSPEYRGLTPSAIRKRLQRGRDAAGPKTLGGIGRALAQCIAQEQDRERDSLPNLSESPDGEARHAVKLPDVWRVSIDQDASIRTRKQVPRKRRRQVPPMPTGWQRETAAQVAARKSR